MNDRLRPTTDSQIIDVSLKKVESIGLTFWPATPEQIHPDMLDDIAEKVSAAIDPEHKVSKAAILGIINNEIADHYRNRAASE